MKPILSAFVIIDKMRTLLAILFLCSTAIAQKNLRTEENLGGAKSIKAIFDLGAVDFTLKKVNDPSKAFKLDYSYSEDEKVPRLTYEINDEKGTLHLSNEKTDSHVSLWGLRGNKDSVYVELANSVPLFLTMNFGVCSANVDLGGMKIADAVFSTGVCSFDLDFSSPNEIECDNIKVKTGVSSVTVKNLSNARAKSINFNGGIGSMKIDFGGKLVTDCDVKVKTGLGSVEISIPSNINTTITTSESFLTGVDVAGFYSQGGGVYRSNVRTGPHLRITIESAMGGVAVKSY